MDVLSVTFLNGALLLVALIPYPLNGVELGDNPAIAPVLWEATFLGIPARIYLWTVPLISYRGGWVVRPASRTYKPS